MERFERKAGLRMVERRAHVGRAVALLAAVVGVAGVAFSVLVRKRLILPNCLRRAESGLGIALGVAGHAILVLMASIAAVAEGFDMHIMLKVHCRALVGLSIELNYIGPFDRWVRFIL